MNLDLIPIINTIIQGIFAIIVAVIGYNAVKAKKSLDKTEKSVLGAEKNIKEISGNLPSWDLLFEHDENGNRIAGSVDRLIGAVDEGYPIKIKILHPDNSKQVMDAHLLSVENGVVHASNTDQISQTRDSSGNFVYQEEAYHYYVIANSNGYFHAKRIYMNGKEGKTTNIKRHMVWIGLVPPRP